MPVFGSRCAVPSVRVEFLAELLLDSCKAKRKEKRKKGRTDRREVAALVLVRVRARGSATALRRSPRFETDYVLGTLLGSAYAPLAAEGTSPDLGERAEPERLENAKKRAEFAFGCPRRARDPVSA